MKRNRAFRRKMRKKWMKHRRAIANTYYGGWDCPDGMFAKGKVHCSCGMCSTKTRNKSFKRRRIHGNYAPNLNWKHSDRLKLDSMDYQENTYLDDQYHDLCRRVFEQDMGYYDEPDWVDANVEGVTLDGIPLDGCYFDHLIENI